MRALIILSLFGVLFLTSCGGRVAIQVNAANGSKAGEIEYGDEKTSVIVDATGTPIGKVDGSTITDMEGKSVGLVEERNGHVLIQDAAKQEVGSLENETDCYGKGTEKLGMINASIDREAAAAACLLLLLPKN